MILLLNSLALARITKDSRFQETNPDIYLTQEVALQMWKECLGVDYLPTTDFEKSLLS